MRLHLRGAQKLAHPFRVGAVAELADRPDDEVQRVGRIPREAVNRMAKHAVQDQGRTVIQDGQCPHEVGKFSAGEIGEV